MGDLMELTKDWLFENFPNIPNDKIGKCFKACKSIPVNSTEEFIHNVCSQVIEGVWNPPRNRRSIYLREQLCGSF